MSVGVLQSGEFVSWASPRQSPGSVTGADSIFSCTPVCFYYSSSWGFKGQVLPAASEFSVSVAGLYRSPALLPLLSPTAVGETVAGSCKLPCALELCLNQLIRKGELVSVMFSFSFLWFIFYPFAWEVIGSPLFFVLNILSLSLEAAQILLCLLLNEKKEICCYSFLGCSMKIPVFCVCNKCTYYTEKLSVSVHMCSMSELLLIHKQKQELLSHSQTFSHQNKYRK